MRRFAKTILLGSLLILGVVVALKGAALLVPSGSWVPEGTMASARSSAAVALLPDGRILVTGGETGSGPVASADFINVDGTISAAPPMIFARSKHVAVALQDGRILIAGGMTAGGSATSAAEMFDPAANSWTNVGAGMTEARSGATAVVLQDGRVLIAGGQNGTAISSTIEIFDPTLGAFTSVGMMSSPRTQHAMAALQDGRVLIVGGNNGTAPVASTDIFDPVADTVSAGPSLAIARFGHSATTLLNGQVVVIGGNNGNAIPSQMDVTPAEIFDPTAGTFTTLATNLATPREGHLAIVLPNNNNVLIVGGTSTGTAVASAELFSQWQGTFAATGTMATARSSAAGTANQVNVPTSIMQRNGVVMVAGGTDGSGNALKTTEAYGYSTVQTDQGDYPPGSPVTITGSGWKPGETVTLTLVESPLFDTHPALTAVADANGNIVNNQFSPDVHDIDIRFYLTAAGGTSNFQAQNTFTDSFNIKTATISVKQADCTTNSITFLVGDVVCASVAVTATGNNQADTYFIQWYGPGGTQAQQTTKSVTSSSQTDTDSLSLTVANALAGTWTVTTCKVSGSTCTSANTWDSKNFTVGKGNQTITFGTLVGKTYGDADFSLSATASSGLTVAFTSQTTSVCAVTGTTVHLISAGTCTIRASQPGNTNYNPAPNVDQSIAVAQKALTVTGITVTDHVYDGGTTATLNVASAALQGVVSGDTVTLNSASYTATFASKNVANGIAVTVTGLALGGAQAGNYTLGQPTGLTGNITHKNLTVTGITVTDHVYDGGTTATLNVASAALQGVVSGDTVTLNSASYTATFASKNVANGIAVTVTGLALGGAQGGNYTLGQPTGLTGNITALHITGSFTASNKIYDGTNSASVLTRALVGAITGDVVSLTGGTATFSDKNVANGKTVTLAGASLTGMDAGNYILDSVATTTANITALHITGSFTASNKIYDGTNSASVLTRALVGAITGDVVILTGGTATFSDKTVANGKTVTLAGASLTGMDAGNYILDSVATTTANITALHITGSFTASNKIYDGTTSATVLTRSLSGTISGDVVSLTGGTATFSDKTVANGKTVTLAGASLTGMDAGNYILDSVATTTANITALHITGSFTASNKTYDGTTSATVLTRSLSGTISGDVVSLTGGTATFSDKTVANGKTVTLAGASLTGTDAGNYILDSVATTTANITALHITGSFTAADKIYDGGTSATVLTRSLIGTISGDVVSLTGGTATFSDKTVANGKTVTLAGASLTGTDAGNYILDSVATTTANITALHITGSFTAADKIYDGGTSATVLTRSLIGTISGDVVSLTGGTATSADKYVGNGKTVTLVGASLTGTDAGNYILDSVATTAADITALHITGSFTAADKIYDGNNSAMVLTRSLIGTISGDVVSLTGGTATFADKNVGNGKTVTLAGTSLMGADSGNYILDSVATTTSNITALHVTGSFTVADKVYDGSTSATVLTRSLIGTISGDAVNLTGGTATFADKNVGNGKTVTLVGATLSGADTQNYILDSVATTTASITTAPITVTLTAANKTYDGSITEPNASMSCSLAGVLASDGANVSCAATSGTFDGSSVGAHTVTATATISGSAFGNYTLGAAGTTLSSTSTTATASITTAAITATLTAANKTYDGTVTEPNASMSCLLTGVLSGDSGNVLCAATSGAFNISQVATANQVTATATISGGAAANYTLGAAGTTLNSTAAIASAQITARPITIKATSISRVFGNSTPSFSIFVSVGSLASVDTLTSLGTPIFTTSPTNPAVNAGSYTIAVSGLVNTNYAIGYDNTGGLTITHAPTMTTVSSSGSPSTFGQAVMFTATVANTQTPPIPTGSVQFQIDGVNFGVAVALSAGGTASVSTSTLSVGSHAVVAVYTNADGNFVGSTSSTLTQQVNFGFVGFGPPYAPPPTTFNVTRTMPLKWQYTNSSGAVVNSSAANPAIIINGPYACGSSDTAGTITVDDAGASGYQYDPGSNSWQFNWQIKGNAVGCYDIYVNSQQSGQTNGAFPISVVNK